MNRVLRSVNPYPSTTLVVAGLGGNLVTTLRLHDVRLARTAEDLPIRIDSVELRYRPLELLAGTPAIREIRLFGPRIVVRQQGDSGWDLLAALRRPSPSAPFAPRSSLPRVIHITRISIEGGAVDVHYGQSGQRLRLENLRAEGDGIRVAGGVRIGQATIHLILRGGGSLDGASVVATGSLLPDTLTIRRLTVRSPRSDLSATGVVPLAKNRAGNLDLRTLAIHLDARPLAYRDLALLHPGFDREGDVAFTLDARGREDGIDLAIGADFADSGSARVHALLVPSITSRFAFQGRGTLQQVDPRLLLLQPGRGERISGEFQADLRGPRTDQMDGWAEVRLRDSRFGGLRARRLFARAGVTAGRARVSVQAQTGPANIGVAGWIRLLDARPTYDLRARLERARGQPAPAWLGRLLGEGGTSLTLRARGEGLDPGEARLTVLVTVVPGSGQPALLESGTIRARLRDGAADVTGQIGIAGGGVAFRGRTVLGQQLRYRIAAGSIEAVDVLAILGDSSGSSLDATFTGQGRGTGADKAKARAILTVTRGALGPHLLADTRVELGLARGLVRIAARGQADGATIDLTATARPFAAEPSFRIDPMRFQHLDVARLARGTGSGSDISGTLALGGRGRRARELRLAGQLALGQSRIGTTPLDSGVVEISLARGVLEVRGRLAGPGGRITLAGSASPFDSIPGWQVREASFRELDLGVLLPERRMRSRLSGSLSLRGRGTAPRNAELAATVRLQPSTINRGTIRGGRAELGLAQGRLRLLGSLEAGDDSLAIDAMAEPFADPPRGRLTASAAVEDLGEFLGRDSLDAGGAGRLVAEGEWGKPGDTRLQGLLGGSGHLGDFWLDSLQVNLRLADGVLQVDTLSAQTNVGAVTGTGPLVVFGRGAGRRSAFRLDGELADLAPLGRTLGLIDLTLGSGRFALSLDGDADRTHLSADVQANDLTYGPQRVHLLQASFVGDVAQNRTLVGGDGDLLLQHLTLGSGHIGRFRARGSYRDQEVTLKADADLDRLRRARLSLRAYPDTSDRRIELDTLVTTSGDESWALTHPVRITYGERLRVEDFALMSHGRGLAIDGVLDRRGEQRLEVRLDSLPVEWITSLMGAYDVTGVAQGSARLAGPAAGPTLNGGLAIALRARGKKIGRAGTELEWTADRGLRLDLGVYHPKGDSLRITSRIPLALSLAPGSAALSRIPGGELAMDAVADKFRISAFKPLFDPLTVKTLEGKLTADAHATGTLEQPHLSGDLELTEAKLQLPRLGATYRNGRVRADLEGSSIRLTQARFESGKGVLEASGAIDMATSPAELDLEATMQDFRLANGEDLRATASGQTTLTGTTSAPVLAGSLKLRDLDFYLQAKSQSQVAQDVELTPSDRRILEDRFGLVADRPLGESKSKLAVDVNLALSGNDWLRRRSGPTVAVELSGQLTLRKQAEQELEIYGEIRPLVGRSFVELLGRRFDVKSGEVVLNGPVRNARVRLDAEYRADSGSSTTPSGVIITTQVAADTGQLSVTLGSRPRLSDADIRSYLATGRPAGTDPTRTGEETDPLAAGASLAVGAALGTVAGGAGRKLGVDVVQILQDRNGEQTLVAGKYVSPPLYLGFREPIMARDDPSKPQTARATTEWEVEYAALEQALLNLQGSGSEFRVFLRLRR